MGRSLIVTIWSLSGHHPSQISLSPDGGSLSPAPSPISHWAAGRLPGSVSGSPRPRQRATVCLRGRRSRPLQGTLAGPRSGQERRLSHCQPRLLPTGLLQAGTVRLCLQRGTWADQHHLPLQDSPFPGCASGPLGPPHRPWGARTPLPSHPPLSAVRFQGRVFLNSPQMLLRSAFCEVQSF